MVYRAYTIRNIFQSATRVASTILIFWINLVVNTFQSFIWLVTMYIKPKNTMINMLTLGVVVWETHIKRWQKVKYETPEILIFYKKNEDLVNPPPGGGGVSPEIQEIRLSYQLFRGIRTYEKITLGSFRGTFLGIFVKDLATHLWQGYPLFWA